MAAGRTEDEQCRLGVEPELTTATAETVKGYVDEPPLDTLSLAYIVPQLLFDALR